MNGANFCETNVSKRSLSKTPAGKLYKVVVSNCAMNTGEFFISTAET